MTKYLAVFASLALAGVAQAQPDEPQSQPEQEEQAQPRRDREPEPKTRLICRRLSPAVTGSQLGHRRCLTAAQWRALARGR